MAQTRDDTYFGWLVGIEVFFISMLTIGMITNLMTIFVLTRNNQKSSTKIYLIGLATSDIIHLVFSLLTYMGIATFAFTQKSFLFWSTFGTIFCIENASSYWSIFIIVCFTAERYCALKYPLRVQKINTRNVAKYALTITLFLSIVISIDSVIQFGATQVPCSSESIEYWNDTHVNETEVDSPESRNSSQREFLMKNINGTMTKCYDDDLNSCYDEVKEEDECYTSEYNSMGDVLLSMFEYVHWIFDFLPLLVLLILNTLLIILIFQARNARRKMMIGNNSCNSSITRKSSFISKEEKSIIGLVTVKAVISICRIPYLIFSTNMLYFSEEFSETMAIIMVIAFLSLDLNATLNFFLFCLLSETYRKDLVKIFKDIWRKCSNSRKNGRTCSSSRSKESSTKFTEVRFTEVNRNEANV